MNDIQGVRIEDVDQLVAATAKAGPIVPVAFAALFWGVARQRAYQLAEGRKVQTFVLNGALFVPARRAPRELRLSDFI